MVPGSLRIGMAGCRAGDVCQGREAMRERAQRPLADDADHVVAASVAVVRGYIGDELLVVGAGMAQEADGIPADHLCGCVPSVAIEPPGAPVGAGCERGSMPVVHEERGTAGPVEGMGRE